MRRIILLSFAVLIIFSSCKLKDATSSSTNPVEPGTSDVTIKVVAPNGGETWIAGLADTLKWNSVGVENVKIEYTINGGATWNVITNSIQSTGSYIWSNIPNVNSLQCKIKISDAVYGTPLDVSDNNFAIMSPGAQQIKITSPNGGEKWPLGSSQNISWNAGGIANVKIEYTINNGISWNTIVASTPSTGYYTWTQVPNTPATNCKIRISDALDGSPSDESDQFFSIGAAPSIAILVPNGNDTWISGSNKDIKWSSENLENVKIEYTTNGGGTWTTIVSSTPSIGTYTWKSIPDANNSLQCRIKISDAVYGAPSDISDDNFAIMNPGVQQIKVTAPNGGEKWSLGSSQNITWDAGGIANVKIEYTINNGNSWNTLIASTPSNGFYTWNQIPNTLSTNCKVRISDAQDGFPSDDSDQFFLIVPAPDIKVVSPNGGETVQSGTNYEIRWTSENVENVKIEYTINGGAVWNTIVSTTPSIGTYVWMNIPSTNSLQCKIRVSDAQNGTPFDLSDQNFQITNLVVKSVKLISPNGGENWEAGTKHNITWNSSNVSKVKIELTTDKGSGWNVIANDLTGGAFDWNISETLNSTQCQIRISDATDNNISDISDAVFIISPKKFITVTGPVTRIYKSNEPIIITWLSGGIEKVGIRYTTTNGIADPSNPAFTELATVGAGTGSYTTYFSLPSDKYFVVVYNADEGSKGMPSNYSPNFTVEKAIIPAVVVLTPNGGEQWLGNEPNVPITDYQKYHPFEIKWHAENTNKVKIEWTTNGGGSWYVVPGADSTANDGIYDWAPGRLDNPARPDSSDNCRIRITSADKGGIQISDMTDGFFSIHKSKMIRLEFPKNGEDFYPPDDLLNPKPSIHWPMLIRWTSYAVHSVNIYYSLDNGVTWVTLATNYQSTGAYSWDFVFGQIENKVSTLGRIKIEDAALEIPLLPPGQRIWDVNDVPFWLNVKK
ncbi:MAG: hypothetical protein ACYC5R_11485 [Melioribacteraceae bacterium]